MSHVLFRFAAFTPYAHWFTMVFVFVYLLADHEWAINDRWFWVGVVQRFNKLVLLARLRMIFGLRNEKSSRNNLGLLAPTCLF